MAQSHCVLKDHKDNFAQCTEFFSEADFAALTVDVLFS